MSISANALITPLNPLTITSSLSCIFVKSVLIVVIAFPTFSNPMLIDVPKSSSTFLMSSKFGISIVVVENDKPETSIENPQISGASLDMISSSFGFLTSSFVLVFTGKVAIIKWKNKKN